MPCNTCDKTMLLGLPPQAPGSPVSCGLRPVLWAETPGHWYSLEQNVQQSGCFFSLDFLGFCANGITGAFQLLGPLGPQVGRGRAGVASPICCILGGSSATYSTVAAIEAITGRRFLSCRELDHFPEIQQTSMDLQQAWKDSSW